MSNAKQHFTTEKTILVYMYLICYSLRGV